MIEYFQNLIHLIQSEKDTVKLSAGQRLYSQGEHGFCMYLIKKGCVKISNGEVLIEMGREGSIFGEESLLQGLPRLANATAVTDSILVLIDEERLDILTRMWPDIYRELHESMIMRRKFFENGFIGLTYPQLPSTNERSRRIDADPF